MHVCSDLCILKNRGKFEILFRLGFCHAIHLNEDFSIKISQKSKNIYFLFQYILLKRFAQSACLETVQSYFVLSISKPIPIRYYTLAPTGIFRWGGDRGPQRDGL